MVMTVNAIVFLLKNNKFELIQDLFKMATCTNRQVCWPSWLL